MERPLSEPWLIQLEDATGAHFGTYDYTASCDLIAAHQLMDSPVCDFARHVMKVALMGTGIYLRWNHQCNARWAS